jgi:tetratricopeptide (TPR) repeat protein
LLERELGSSSDAQADFRQAIAIRERLVRENPAAEDYQDGLGWCYAHLAGAQFQADLLAEAAASYRQLVAIREQLVQDHPARTDYQHQLALGYRELGDLQVRAGHLDAASSAYRAALAIRERLLHAYPDSVALKAQLATDAVLCGDALALAGTWSASADLYVQAAQAGDDSWQTLQRLALVQVAAGNDAGYRTTCADLVRRHGNSTDPQTLLAMAFTTLVGDHALDDGNQTLALAHRAATENPQNALASILAGVAEFRADHAAQAVATINAAIDPLDHPPGHPASGQIRVGLLLGATTLALAYQHQANTQALERQLTTLHTLLAQAEPTPPHDLNPLPNWTLRLAHQIANRQLAKFKGKSDVPSQAP